MWEGEARALRREWERLCVSAPQSVAKFEGFVSWRLAVEAMRPPLRESSMVGAPSSCLPDATPRLYDPGEEEEEEAAVRWW
eukprot:SAG25_NODE_482_length_7499_cov_12.630946_10_plen_81_part_00